MKNDNIVMQDESLVMVAFTYGLEYDLEAEDEVVTGIIPFESEYIVK